MFPATDLGKGPMATICSGYPVSMLVSGAFALGMGMHKLHRSSTSRGRRYGSPASKNVPVDGRMSCRCPSAPLRHTRGDQSALPHAVLVEQQSGELQKIHLVARSDDTVFPPLLQADPTTTITDGRPDLQLQVAQH